MKLLKRLMSKRNNAGFTLVEVIISVALLGVLLASMTLFVGPVLEAAADAKDDIRATVLAETVDAFIDRSVKYSSHVAVFNNVPISGAERTTRMEAIYNSEELKKFKEYFESDPAAQRDKFYEIRCIGICWRMDDRTNESKFMLSMGKVGKAVSGRYEILDTAQVFEDCFYEDLFPTVNIEKVESTDGGSEKKIVALKLNIDVYSNDAMTTKAMTGVGYTQFINENIITVNPDPAEESDEKTDTYIFYITRKAF